MYPDSAVQFTSRGEGSTSWSPVQQPHGTSKPTPTAKCPEPANRAPTNPWKPLEAQRPSNQHDVSHKARPVSACPECFPPLQRPRSDPRVKGYLTLDNVSLGPDGWYPKDPSIIPDRETGLPDPLRPAFWDKRRYFAWQFQLYLNSPEGKETSRYLKNVQRAHGG